MNLRDALAEQHQALMDRSLQVVHLSTVAVGVEQDALNAFPPGKVLCAQLGELLPHSNVIRFRRRHGGLVQHVKRDVGELIHQRILQSCCGRSRCA